MQSEALMFLKVFMVSRGRPDAEHVSRNLKRTDAKSGPTGRSNLLTAHGTVHGELTSITAERTSSTGSDSQRS